MSKESDVARGDPDVSFPFDNEPGAPRGARAALRPLLSDDGDPIADAVQLATSELVANVVQHTEGGGLMEAWDPKPDVPFRVAVSDDDPALPTGGANVPDERGGRGLQIVEAVSDEWGVDTSNRGKTIWAEFDRRRHGTPPNEEDRVCIGSEGVSPFHTERALKGSAMSSTDEKITSDLIETLRNGEEGFRTAAERLGDGSRPELRDEFMSFSQQRAGFCAELSEMAKAYGDNIAERSTAPGAIHRGWLAIKDALTGDSPEAVLKAAVTGEDHAVSEYEDALAADISQGLRDVVSRQFTQVSATRDRVKLLAEQASG